MGHFLNDKRNGLPSLMHVLTWAKQKQEEAHVNNVTKEQVLEKEDIAGMLTPRH